jgi:hypothetical protein
MLEPISFFIGVESYESSGNWFIIQLFVLGEPPLFQDSCEYTYPSYIASGGYDGFTFTVLPWQTGNLTYEVEIIDMNGSLLDAYSGTINVASGSINNNVGQLNATIYAQANTISKLEASVSALNSSLQALQSTNNQLNNQQKTSQDLIYLASGIGAVGIILSLTALYITTRKRRTPIAPTNR